MYELRRAPKIYRVHMKGIKFIQITDPHILEDDNSKLYNLPINEIQYEIISEVKKIESEIDFILITGDISDKGTVDSYINAKNIYSSLAIPLYWLPGNHDDLTAMNVFNNDENINYQRSFSIREFHFILLNSVAISSKGKNRSSGVLSHVELYQLEAELRRNTTKLVVIALHHPPIRSGTWKDDRMLENAKEFLDLIKYHKNVKLVLFGHQHHIHESMFDNIQFYSPPSASFHFDRNIKFGFVDLPPGFGIVSANPATPFRFENIHISINISPIYDKVNHDNQK